MPDLYPVDCWHADPNWIVVPPPTQLPGDTTGLLVVVEAGEGATGTWNEGVYASTGWANDFTSGEPTQTGYEPTPADLIHFGSAVGSAGATGGRARYRDPAATAALGQVVCDGNSLTSGAGSSGGQNYPNILAALLGDDWLVTNKGVSGQTTPDMAGDADTDVDPLYDAGTYEHNVLVAWEGTNDLYFGASAADAYAALVAYCQARQAAGWTVVVATLLPRGDFPGTSTLPGGDPEAEHETRRQAVNALIRANWATFADALADVAADARIGDDGDEDGATYYAGDGVHLSNAGYAAVAPLFEAAVLAAIAPGGGGDLPVNFLRPHFLSSPFLSPAFAQ